MIKKQQVVSTLTLTCACAGLAFAQEGTQAPAPTLKTRPAPSRAAASSPVSASAKMPTGNVALMVPQGTPLEVRLDQEVRVRKAGQAVHGKLVQPIYAFDREVIPSGSEISGKIAKIEVVPGGRRTLAALDANFSPDHKLVLEFDELTMADGSRRPLRTTVTPGVGEPIEFVTSKQGEKSAVSSQIEKAKQQAKQAWNEAKRQVTEPGRMHRLERYLVAQLPIHPQYLDAGAMFTAELNEPLDFGTVPLTEKMVAKRCEAPPRGSVVQTRLLTPLDSSTAQVGESIEAVLSRPLFDGESLVLPTGSSLKGSVLQAKPSGKMHQNGQLRIVFHVLDPPECTVRRVNAIPVGVGAPKSQHLVLDSEGGAEATSPDTRYLSTALAIGLAAVSTGSDSDARDGGGDVAGNASNRAAGGLGGFKLIGFTVGLFVHSQPLGMAMGSAGAARSIYSNFASKGREVVYAKNTPMSVSVGGIPEPSPVCNASPSTDTPEHTARAVACAMLHVRMF